MTDKQFLDIFLKRACKAMSDSKLHDPQIVIGQQYGKKLIFGVSFKNSMLPFYNIRFIKDNMMGAFVVSNVPKNLEQWKQQVIRDINASSAKGGKCYVSFDLSTTPKEIVHIFFSALIDALKTPGMGVALLAQDYIFFPDETYEEISIEADLNLWLQ